LGRIFYEPMKPRTFETRILSLVVAPKGSPHFSDAATVISLESEGAGEYVRISQGEQPEGQVAFDDDEWPHIVDAVNRLFLEAAKLNHEEP
jgi:hypothetical protein